MLIFLMIWLNVSLDTDSSCRIWRQQWNYCRPNYLLEGGTIRRATSMFLSLQQLSVSSLPIPTVLYGQLLR